MEKLSLSEVCFLGGSIFRRTKKKFPDEKVFHGISLAGLGKNFGGDSVSEWRHGTARENLAGSAIGGGRPPTREILGLKKKSSLQGLAGEVLTICREGGSRVGNWRGVNVAGRGFGTSRFVMGRVSSGHGGCQPLANPQALAAMDRRARAVRGRRHVS